MWRHTEIDVNWEEGTGHVDYHVTWPPTCGDHWIRVPDFLVRINTSSRTVEAWRWEPIGWKYWLSALLHIGPRVCRRID